jgi:hypothetical protein
MSPKNQSVQMSQKDLAMEQRILSFQSQITSNLKSGSSYPIDTAVRYIEGLVNYNYGDVSNTLSNHHVYSVLMQVSLTNGQVTLTEMATTYNKIIDSLTVQFENLPSSNGHLIYADIFRRDSTSGSVTFGIISSFCCGTQITEPVWQEGIDYWEYGNAWCGAGGYCDGPNEGDELWDDAAEQIERKIRMHIGVHQSRNYLDDIETLFITGDGTILDSLGNTYTCDNFRVPNDPLDNYCDYYVHFQGDYDQNTPMHDCLTPTEMNFYYNGTSSTLYDLIYECDEAGPLVEGKEFTDLDIIGQAVLFTEHTYYVHSVTVGYGVLYINQEPAFEF